MIDFAKFSTQEGITDNSVGISITHLIKKTGLNAYATSISAGKKIGCHAHAEGDEWYIILSGKGEIWTGDVVQNSIDNIASRAFSQGCVFCISPNTAHQLVAIDNVELLFLCPEAHLSQDRVCFADLCSDSNRSVDIDYR